MTSDSEDRLFQKISYLKDCYGFYIQHINSMFNFFLVAAGLFANASVLSMSKDYDLPASVRAGMCWFAASVCLIFLFIHFGTRRDLDAIESALRREEALLFSGLTGFLTAGPSRKPLFMRLKYLFPAAYLMFLIAFSLAALWQNPPWYSIEISSMQGGLGIFSGPLSIGDAASTAGLAMTALGAFISARAVILTRENAREIGVSRWAPDTPEKMDELPHVKALMSQSHSARRGLMLITAGTLFQFGPVVEKLFGWAT